MSWPMLNYVYRTRFWSGTSYSFRQSARSFVLFRLLQCINSPLTPNKRQRIQHPLIVLTLSPALLLLVSPSLWVSVCSWSVQIMDMLAFDIRRWAGTLRWLCAFMLCVSCGRHRHSVGALLLLSNVSASKSIQRPRWCLRVHWCCILFATSSAGGNPDRICWHMFWAHLQQKQRNFSILYGNW